MSAKLTLRLAALFTALILILAGTALAEDFGEDEEEAVGYGKLFSDLAQVQMDLAQIDDDLAAMNDDLADLIAAEWKRVYLAPDWEILLSGKDDPARLPITGPHAFVVLGYELLDGEMTDELKARCDAAAEAAEAFPGSILVCSGGATGDNNPDKHTEAGLIRDYLVSVRGVAPERIFTDERAMSTLGNALNTYEILKAQGIAQITVVTSGYHQRRAHMLYYTLTRFMNKWDGTGIEIAGNYGCDVPGQQDLMRYDAIIAAFQMEEMMSTLLSGLRETREMVVNYAAYGDAADKRNAALIEEIRAFNPDAAARWESIMALWKSLDAGCPVNEGVLPDGLPDTDELCLVALGFQLNPDGTMRDELIGRLEVLLRSAEKYPNALIVCTGGGTASLNEDVTEAGAMADWLIAHGVDKERVIIEDLSMTTAQNAIYTFDCLTESYPQVNSLAIVSSDYHIATGALLFGAEAILRAEAAGKESVRVVSNAAYKAPSGSLSAMFKAGALIELMGDRQTAFEIYYDTYTIHELPKID